MIEFNVFCAPLDFCCTGKFFKNDNVKRKPARLQRLNVKKWKLKINKENTWSIPRLSIVSDRCVERGSLRLYVFLILYHNENMLLFKIIDIFNC